MFPRAATRSRCGSHAQPLLDRHWFSGGYGIVTDDIESLLDRISIAKPANEAEVETKILLHLFRILGYTDDDRADKPAIAMQFGRERKWKNPDFVLYQGVDRSLGAALVTVEAKAPTEHLEDAEFQAQSYAPWAGTPYYLVSNGKTIKAVQFLPGAAEFRSVEFAISDIHDRWQELVDFLGRGAAILTKERLSYTSLYLPEVEQLPPHEFFREYLLRVESRFRVAPASVVPALSVPDSGISRVPHIPVSVRLDQFSRTDMAPEQLAADLLARPVHLIVSGVAGSGKSTLCRRVAGQLAASGLAGAAVLPVYILLSRAVPNDPVSAFRMACEEMGIRFYDQLFKRPLSQARFVLILDGFDEIEITDFTSQLLVTLLREPSIYSALVATRPIALDDVGSLFDQGTFERAHIRDLSDTEIGQLFARYLEDSDRAVELLQSVPADVREMLRLPLFALMAIRVSQTHAKWQSLSKYCLFELYVGVLNEYFGTPTVRGGAVGLEDLLSCLVEVAVILHRNGRNGVSLGDLRHAMEQLGMDLEFRALLNTGLLITAQGKASFVHRSFLEFGLARGMLQAIHEEEEIRFGRQLPATEGAYELVRGETDENEQKVLLVWAVSAASNKTRTRAINILRERVGPEVVDMLVKVLKSKAPSKVWKAALRALLHNDQPRLVKALPDALNADRTRNRILVRTLRSNGVSPDVITSIAIELQNTKGVGATEGLAKIVTHFNLVDHVVPAASAFAAQPVDVRRWIPRRFYSPRAGDALVAFVDLQLTRESDPEVLFRLLYTARSYLGRLSERGLLAATSRIKGLQLRTIDDLRNAEKLRSLAARENDSAAIAELTLTMSNIQGHRRPRSD